MNTLVRDRRQRGDEAAATAPRLSEENNEHATTDVDETTPDQHGEDLDTETPALAAASRAIQSGSPGCYRGEVCGRQNQPHGRPQRYADPSIRRAGAATMMERGTARGWNAGLYRCCPVSADGWPRRANRRTGGNENVSATGHGEGHATRGRRESFRCEGSTPLNRL